MTALDDVDDKELLTRHVDGGSDAFAELVRCHQDRLWVVAIRTLGDREEAADALQDALLSAFRRAGSFRGDAAVTTWLHRIVVNACLDRVRRNRVRPADALPDDLDHLAELGTAPQVDPVLEREERIDVASALGTLTAEQRAAIVLVDMEGYSVDEAATLLDCPPGTVKSRCARGRARLLPLLAHLRAAQVTTGMGGGGNQKAPPSVASSGGRPETPPPRQLEQGGEVND